LKELEGAGFESGETRKQYLRATTDTVKEELGNRSKKE